MSYLFQPLQVGSLALANRLVMPPMATAKAGIDGKVNSEVLDYYTEKSEGGYLSILDISGGFSGYIAPLSEGIKQVVSIPVILTGGIIDVQVAEQLLEKGKADLIGVGRAVLKDSKWAKRAVESLQ